MTLSLQKIDRIWRISTNLWAFSISRIVVIVAYVVIIGWIVYVVVDRSGPEAPTATRTLHRNELIAKGDLETREIAALSGKYLRQDVDPAQTVTTAMVSQTKLPVVSSNTIAAVLAIARKDMEARKIVVGTTVDVCRNGAPIIGAVKVIDSECSEDACSLVVSLNKPVEANDIALGEAFQADRCNLQKADAKPPP
jgi:hypothetical protein